jgi:hypothetical protein
LWLGNASTSASRACVTGEAHGRARTPHRCHAAPAAPAQRRPHSPAALLVHGRHRVAAAAFVSYRPGNCGRPPFRCLGAGRRGVSAHASAQTHRTPCANWRQLLQHARRPHRHAPLPPGSPESLAHATCTCALHAAPAAPDRRGLTRPQNRGPGCHRLPIRVCWSTGATIVGAGAADAHAFGRQPLVGTPGGFDHDLRCVKRRLNV